MGGYDIKQKKTIWDKKITASLTISERSNLVLVYLAKEKNLTKGQMLEELLKTHPTFLDALEQMRDDGWVEL